MTHALLHCFELLLLLIVQGRLNRAVRVLNDCSCFRAAIILRERLILKQCLELLLPINQDWLDLALLVSCQVEFLRHVLQLPVGIHAPLPTRAGTWLSLI